MPKGVINTTSVIGKTGKIRQRATIQERTGRM